MVSKKPEHSFDKIESVNFPDFILLQGEELLHVQDVNEVSVSRPPSALKELIKLAQATRPNDIGDFGPVLASLSLDNHDGNPLFHRYEAVFGRDSLRVALDLVDYYPKLTRTTLLNLAQSQGVKKDNVREEEPGRIIHEDRDPKQDPVARELSAERGWGWPYYGSVDATPEFIRTIAAYCDRSEEGASFLDQTYSGRDSQQHDMGHSLNAAVDWILDRIGSNSEGLLEFRRSNPGGIENQVWRDSWDSYFHKDGSMANHEEGVASTEVQRIAMDALLDAADLFQQFLNQPKKAEDLKQKAETLKKLILGQFWVEEEGGYFSLGADRDSFGNLRQLKIKTSNMGQLLHSRLLDGEKDPIVGYREAVITQLFSPAMLCRNGVRTLATDEVRFRPGAYHNGSVWVWDNYLLIQGLIRHGYFGLASFLEDRLLDDVNTTKRMAEFFRGDNDPNHRLNTSIVEIYDHVNDRINMVEQPPQDIQAWSVAAIMAIKFRRSSLPRVATDAKKLRFENDLLSKIKFD